MPLLLRPSLLVGFCLAFALSPAAAQSRPGLVSFQRIAIPDDVPAHLTTAMVQDQRGLLWLGTQDGLVRYDGYGFKVYRAKPGDPNALGGSYVRSLMVARDGRLWVATISGGLAVFDPRTERFTQYRHDAARPDSLGHDRVEGIAEDGDGKLWLATDDGLDRLDPASGKFQHFRMALSDAANQAGNQLRAVLFDRDGRLWVGSRSGLQRWLGDGRFEAVAASGADGAMLAGVPITKLMQDKRGRIWIGTARDGAAVYDPAKGILTRLGPPPKTQTTPKTPMTPMTPMTPAASAPIATGSLSHFWVYSLTETANGEIWLGTFGGGIDVVDPDTLKVVDRLRHDALPSTVGNDRIGALLSDRSGLVWAGTWGGGLARHDPAARAFLKLRHSPREPNGPSHPAIVRAMETADGNLWLGTNGNGIDVLGPDGLLRNGYRPDPAAPGALADGSVSCLAQGPDGTVWVGTLDGTLHRLRPGERTFKRYDAKAGLPGGPIRAMVFAPDGALWIGALNGLARVDAASGRVTAAYVHKAEDPSTLAGREVESLAFTPDGTLWAGSDNGLTAFDTSTGKGVRIRREAGRADSLPDNWVPDLMTARDGKLWLATQSGAAVLQSWDGKTARFDLLGPRLHLPSGPAESLIEDAQGQVWLNGKVRIDPVRWTHRSYGPADGNEFRTLYIASRSRMRDGGLLFGSPEGLLVLRPGLLRDWTYQPPLVASAVRVDGVEQPGAAVLGQLVLQPQQRDLRLEFAALDYSAPQKLQYRYRLEGYDAGWTALDASQRMAAYTHLPPGDYRLRIQGSNRAGAWSPAELNMAVTVVPAFYQTWWCRALMWLLGAAAVAGLFRLRLRHLRRRSAHLERTVAERTADLQAAYRRIEEASLTDPLTGLRNRRFLEQAIGADLMLAARRHGECPVPADADLVLLMLDLDHFKQVNDVHGHAAGDAVLVQAAAVLKHCMRASDYVVRWGGEEFLLVARFVGREQGPLLAEKIRAAIAAHAFTLPDGQVLRKTVSIGFAPFPFAPGLAGMAGGQGAAPGDLDAALDTLQRMADTALYAAKRSWRNGWVGVAPRAQHPPAPADSARAAHVANAADAANAQIAARVARFLSDAESAVAEGGIDVLADEAKRNTLRWH